MKHSFPFSYTSWFFQPTWPNKLFFLLKLFFFSSWFYAAMLSLYSYQMAGQQRKWNRRIYQVSVQTCLSAARLYLLMKSLSVQSNMSLEYYTGLMAMYRSESFTESENLNKVRNIFQYVNWSMINWYTIIFYVVVHHSLLYRYLFLT